jgi:hypothetical protein
MSNRAQHLLFCEYRHSDGTLVAVAIAAIDSGSECLRYIESIRSLLVMGRLRIETTCDNTLCSVSFCDKTTRDLVCNCAVTQTIANAFETLRRVRLVVSTWSRGDRPVVALVNETYQTFFEELFRKNPGSFQ